MKGLAMKLALVVITLLVLTGVVMAWTGRRILAEDAALRMTSIDPATANEIETHIPFDVRITSTPPPWCDPVDLVVELDTDASGSVTEERWTVMDGIAPQMTFESFDDLYYRCDGPDCFRITVKQANENRTIYVTLK